MKKAQKLIVSLLALFFMSASIAYAAPELPDAAITNATPHLPQQAQLNAPPFKTITIESDTLTAYARPHYVSIDDPMNHETSIGTPMDGVAKLILTRSDFTVGCSGTLLSSTIGDYVLTAAHCVSDEFGSNIFVTGTATFAGINRNESITITGVNIHPDWDGNIIRGNDVAVLTLTHRPDAGINSYDIDRTNKFDVGSISEKIGYGLSGIGKIDPSLGFGIKRNGLNRYDAAADTMLKALGLRGGRDFVRNSVLQYDFDDGTVAHDAFGFFFGINDGRTSDTSSGVDSSIGEFAGDTHVAIYASWIDSVTGGVSTSSDTTTQTKCNRRQQMLGNC